MGVAENPSRRTFLGTSASAAGALAGAAAVGEGLAACSSGSSQPEGPRKRAARPARHTVVSENAMPGDRHWWIKHFGAPDAIMGYAGQASVLPGQPVHLYVSTTSREFTVKAFRMGWYGGDLARRVWESRPVRGHRQRRASRTRDTNTVHAQWGLSMTVPTDGWPAGSYLLR